MVEVNFVIVHQIEKEPGGRPNLILSSHQPPEMDKANELIQKLHDSFSNNITYGKFGTPVRSFQQYLDAYRVEENSGGFINCTQSMMNELSSRLVSIGGSKGGYFLFSQYTSGHSQFFSVFLIRNTQSMLFEFRGDSIGIGETTHIDLDRLAMASRINIANYRTDSGRYVSLIKKRLPDISDYFMEWIGVVDQENNKTDTKNLKTLLSSNDLPSLADGTPSNATQVLNIAHRFIKDAPGRIVSISDLSSYLFGNPEVIHNLAEQHGLELNSEFKADSRMLKTFRLIQVKSGGINLEFPIDTFQNVVRIDQNAGPRIIIESQELVDKILAETDYD